jgi:MraZ protein
MQVLTGTFPRTLDDKNRLVFPKRIREQLRDPKRIFFAPGPDQCLWIFTEEGMERLAEKHLGEAPATDEEVRAFRRLFFAQTEQLDVDRAGRVLLTDRLKQFASLQRDVVLIGVVDHLELWEASRWEAYSTQNAARFDAIAEAAFKKK